MKLIFFLAAWLLAVSCTENFLFDDEIEPRTMLSVEGNVRLQWENSYEGVYVYLEGFDIHTLTAADGSFKLEIPQNPRLQPGNGVNGAFYIWYYVDNFQLGRSLTLVREGQFSYGHADVNDKGRIKSTVVLTKLIDIATAVSPSVIGEEYGGPVQIDMTLTNRVDSVYINIYERKYRELGGVYVISQADSNDLHFVRLENARNRAVLVDSIQHWQMIVERDSLPLFPGKYDIVPFVKVNHPDMPAVLRDRFGANAATFSREFLGLPRRVLPAAITIGLR